MADSDFIDSSWLNEDDNDTYILLFPTDSPISHIGSRHWIALVCYGLVFLLGVPGNALVVWVTAFRLPNSVNAQWFLNLAIADLLCCSSLPILMVPLAQDQHWIFGNVACKLLHGLFFMMMYCSVLLLVVISLDRFLLVSKPVWCQNHRTLRHARLVCLLVWALALVGTSPQFVHMETHKLDEIKILCSGSYSSHEIAWAVILTRTVVSFVLPFVIICVSHWKVYAMSNSGQRRKREKSKRTLRVILALVLSFFVCWFPLHIVDLLMLITYGQSERHYANLQLAHVLTLCLAYTNSCLNPLLYVCLGRGFKKNLINSLRSVLHFASEAPLNQINTSTHSRSTTDSAVRENHV